jgi:hypothetical protein
MKIYWGIHSGESIEVYDGDDAKGKIVMYRIGVERVDKGEVKIVRPSAKPRIINNESRMKVLDITTNGSLFIEYVGKDGFACGWYEFVSAL